MKWKHSDQPQDLSVVFINSSYICQKQNNKKDYPTNPNEYINI